MHCGFHALRKHMPLAGLVGKRSCCGLWAQHRAITCRDGHQSFRTCAGGVFGARLDGRIRGSLTAVARRVSSGTHATGSIRPEHKHKHRSSSMRTSTCGQRTPQDLRTCRVWIDSCIKVPKSGISLVRVCSFHRKHRKSRFPVLGSGRPRGEPQPPQPPHRGGRAAPSPNECPRSWGYKQASARCGMQPFPSESPY